MHWGVLILLEALVKVCKEESLDLFVCLFVCAYCSSCCHLVPFSPALAASTPSLQLDVWGW